MTSDADADRLRELQRKAYAPGAELSPEEADELAALQAPAPEPDSAPDPTAETPVSCPDPQESAPISGGLDRNEGSRREKRMPRRGLVLIALVALVVGIGAGWALFGWERPAGLSAEQEKTRIQLEESEDYDPGTVRFEGEREGVTAWLAERHDGDEQCLVLRQEGTDHPTVECRLAEEKDTTVLAASATVEDRAFVSAALLEDASGEEVVAMQFRELTDPYDWESQYTDDELAVARTLEDAGYDGEYLSIVGDDGDRPIWLFQDPADEQCLLAADTEKMLGEACAPYSIDGSLRLELPDVTYEVAQSDRRGPQLIILRDPSAVKAPDGKANRSVRDDDE